MFDKHERDVLLVYLNVDQTENLVMVASNFMNETSIVIYELICDAVRDGRLKTDKSNEEIKGYCKYLNEPSTEEYKDSINGLNQIEGLKVVHCKTNTEYKPGKL